MNRYLWLLLIPLVAARAAFAQQPAASPSGDGDYAIESDVLINTEGGATVSALVVRRKDGAARLPTLLNFDIYSDPAAAVARGKDAVDHGYVAVTADTRGKRLSPDPIVPYEFEAVDAYHVIDWIARQPWSDGRVGMRGGSYSGFTAWAATKRMHPALKTLAVSAAAIPGLGLPMHNNVFLNANYGWVFYVTDNKLLDEKTYNDPERWDRLIERWFASGRPYREIDAVDGTPNPLLQRWLNHPAYDAYWQRMVPYKRDFAHVNIPVLTITGYYDDGQISALEYVRQHTAFNPRAEHYVVIGPYDHLGTHRSSKAPVLRGYAIDAAAQFSTPELVYQWMDFVLKGGARPARLEDKVNFEVMGANEWHHARSLEDMSRHPYLLYLRDTAAFGRYPLKRDRPAQPRWIKQTVDLADRKHPNNLNYYPAPIIEERLEAPTGPIFASEPLARPEVISGAFSGELDVAINKRDADLAVTVLEQMADGRVLHLAYWLGRASFADDPERRQLLAPGRPVRIPFTTLVVSRRLEAGSRLLVLLDVNKNAFAEVNYGTGRDVGGESIDDAKSPLEVAWGTDSFVTVPAE